MAVEVRAVSREPSERATVPLHDGGGADSLERVRAVDALTQNPQIVLALHQVEGGEHVTEVCRRLGVSEQTFYRWKKQFSGLVVTEFRNSAGHVWWLAPRALVEASFRLIVIEWRSSLS